MYWYHFNIVKFVDLLVLNLVLCISIGLLNLVHVPVIKPVPWYGVPGYMY